MSDKYLCPFKKDIERVTDKRSGKVTVRERFAPCAGDRCMAYDRHLSKAQCLRLEAQK